MAYHAAGTGGEIRAGGRVAATLGEWDIERVNRQWTGHAVLANTTVVYGMAERYELRLARGTGHWRWRDVQIAGDGSIRFEIATDPERI